MHTVKIGTLLAVRYGLAALTGRGMTNLEALRAVTPVAAQACG